MANHDWFEFSYVGLLLSLETVDRAPPPWANNLTYSRMHWKMYICTIPLRWESRAAAAVKCRAGQGFTNIVVEEWNRQRTIWLRRANVICIAIFECTNCFWFNPQERKNSLLLTIYRQREELNANRLHSGLVACSSSLLLLLHLPAPCLQHGLKYIYSV